MFRFFLLSRVSKYQSFSASSPINCFPVLLLEMILSQSYVRLAGINLKLSQPITNNKAVDNMKRGRATQARTGPNAGTALI